MVEVLIRKKINSDEILGTFISKDYYDRVIDSDCDLYAWNQTGINDESNIIFKFRKNVFTKEEQDAAYAGLREAATESQNRGMAAGPRGEQLGQENRGNRDWVTAEQLEILQHFARPLNTIDDGTTIETIKESHKRGSKEETRGQVWLRSEVTKLYPEYHGWFDKWLAGAEKMPREQQIHDAIFIVKNYISDTNYAQSVMSGIA
jgi:hypothetical protein